MPISLPEKDQAQQTEITLLLRRWEQGDSDAFEELSRVTYEELRQVARRLLFAARQHNAVQTESLVNETLLRLMGVDELQAESRAAFFKYAIKTMRNLIIDSVRKRHRAIHGGGVDDLPLEEIGHVSEERCRQLIALDDALKDMKHYQPEFAQIIELRYFGGLTITEIAEVIGKSEATIKRREPLALRWLKSYMEGDGHESRAH